MSPMALAATLTAALAAAPEAPADKIPMVTLRIDGIHDEADGRVVATALAKIPNIKVATRPTPDQPFALVGPLKGATYDLGDLARAVAATDTPNRNRGAPSASLVLHYKGLKDAAKIETQLAKNLETTCAKLKGVQAKKCRLDTVQKEVLIQLDGQGGAKWSAVRAAFPDLEIE